MSHFRKRFARANKERSQPAHRAKFGLLEKHKDYVKRARDYNAKKEQLRALKEKAALRNPDEFYFHMENSTLKDGLHVELDKQTLTPDQLRLLNTHDQAYLTLARQKEGKAIERLQAELQFVGVERPKSHIVFVDSVEDAKAFDVAVYFDTAPELVGRFHNRPRLSQLDEDQFAAEPDELGKRKRESYKELESRLKRKATLDEMLDKVELQRKMMAPGERKLIKDKKTGKTHVRWAPERKR